MDGARHRLSDWLGRLARYVYLAECVEGRDVLELDCGTGIGCELLANQGARRVVGVDPSAERIAEARVRRSLTNVEYRVNGDGRIDIPDASIDVIFAHGEADLRRPSRVDELRRILRPSGALVWSAPSADRRRARGGASFYELADRLGNHFGSPRMLAVQPLVGLSLVDYADDELELELDTSLARVGAEAEEVCEYVAVFGDTCPIRRYCVVQLPSLEGLTTLEAALGVSAADAERLRSELDAERRSRHRAESMNTDLKMRVAELERGFAARSRPAAGVDASLAYDADLASSLGAAPGQARREPGPDLEKALAGHVANLRELERVVAERDERIAELEEELLGLRLAAEAGDGEQTVAEETPGGAVPEPQDLGDPAAELTFLIIGLRALKARMREAAAELERCGDPATARAVAARLKAYALD